MKCDGGHKHQQLINGRAKAAAQYPKGLCQAICAGLRRQLDQDKHQLKCLMSITASDEVDARSVGGGDKRSRGVAHEEDESEEEVRRAWDDVSGKELDGKQVQRARMKEL